MHQAVVYEMKTAAAPEKHMANNKNDRPSGGLRADHTVNNELRGMIAHRSSHTHKFSSKFSTPQSSMRTEAMMRTGIHSKLL
jgi:hypothetical protein